MNVSYMHTKMHNISDAEVIFLYRDIAYEWTKSWDYNYVSTESSFKYYSHLNLVWYIHVFLNIVKWLQEFLCKLYKCIA